MKRMRRTVLFACVATLLASSTAAAGFSYATSIWNIDIVSGSHPVALIQFKDQLFNSPSCVSANRKGHLAIDLSTTKGRAIMDYATNLLVTNAPVLAVGTGTCSVISGVETISSLASAYP